ncbi:MAG: CDP-alcohol phosphatidyltransferase family protein [Firmicutes bacterium]|nr:CDP-alcohol phosphatidyltransferase family protein [Bacillota bacterium]MCL2771239.1 CDP-alcohol phosphatidyltransferase family protein [Bacillota bacterium]
MKLRYIPNILGGMRITLSIALIPCFLFFWINDMTFLLSDNYWFSIFTITIFMVAGFTDIIDGTIARNIKGGQSNMGATIDGISDMTMVGATVIFFTPIMHYGEWVYPVWIAALCYKVAVGVFGHFRHGSKSILIHSYAMKLLGFVLFIIPIFYFFTNGAAWVEWYLVGVLAYLVLVITEELLIHIMLKGSSQDIKTIFHYKRENAKIMARQAAETKETK